MKGKKTCETLKAIRQRIADENAIPFLTKPCDFQGECRGTCPACEAEVRYLEKELTARKKLGKSITLAGIAACVMLSAAGCGEAPTAPADPTPTTSQTTQATEITDGLIPHPTEEVLVGESTDYVLDGDVAQPYYEYVLSGIVADDDFLTEDETETPS